MCSYIATERQNKQETSMKTSKTVVFGDTPVSCLKSPYSIFVWKTLAHIICPLCKHPGEKRYLLLLPFLRSFHILIYWQEIILLLYTLENVLIPL